MEKKEETIDIDENNNLIISKRNNNNNEVDLESLYNDSDTLNNLKSETITKSIKQELINNDNDNIYEEALKNDNNVHPDA